VEEFLPIYREQLIRAGRLELVLLSRRPVMDILELTAGLTALMLIAPVPSTITEAAGESAGAVLKDTNGQNVGTASSCSSSR
jgi:hypothetical protein